MLAVTRTIDNNTYNCEVYILLHHCYTAFYDAFYQMLIGNRAITCGDTQIILGILTESCIKLTCIFYKSIYARFKLSCSLVLINFARELLLPCHWHGKRGSLCVIAVTQMSFTLRRRLWVHSAFLCRASESTRMDELICDVHAESFLLTLVLLLRQRLLLPAIPCCSLLLRSFFRTSIRGIGTYYNGKIDIFSVVEFTIRCGIDTRLLSIRCVSA